MKGVFILHEGIPSSIFDSQVVGHILHMKNIGIDIDILSFNTEIKILNNSIENKKKLNKIFPAIKIHLINSINIFYPLSFIFHSLQLLFFLKSKEYNFIHSRSDYSQFISLIIKPFFPNKFIWDCRGDSLDELKFAVEKKSLFIKLYSKIYLIPLQKFIINFCKKKSDGAIYVSEDLKKNRLLKNKNFIIVPCTSSPDLFYFDESLRKKTREELDIKCDEKVFIYVGSMVPYQSFELFNDIFIKINQSNYLKLLVVTNDIKKASENFKNVNQNKLIIKSSSFYDMNKYYNVADSAILFRSNRKLNNVASPTKFGEYCLTGLPVLMNDNVIQALNFSKSIGNYRNLLSKNYFLKDFKERLIISKKSRNFFDRKKFITSYKKIYCNG